MNNFPRRSFLSQRGTPSMYYIQKRDGGRKPMRERESKQRVERTTNEESKIWSCTPASTVASLSFAYIGVAKAPRMLCYGKGEAVHYHKRVRCIDRRRKRWRNAAIRANRGHPS